MSKVYVVSIDGSKPLVFSTDTKAIAYAQDDFGDFYYDGSLLQDIEPKTLVDKLNNEGSLSLDNDDGWNMCEIDILEVQ